MPRYMLDTDTSSYIMKRSNDSVLRRLRKTLVCDVCISVITKAELLFGVETSPRRPHDEAALGAFLAYVEVLDFPRSSSSRLRKDPHRLAKEGHDDRRQLSVHWGACSQPRLDSGNEQHV
jgi:tRNA(fMet)-specific endonuclease VapC